MCDSFLIHDDNNLDPYKMSKVFKKMFLKKRRGREKEKGKMMNNF